MSSRLDAIKLNPKEIRRWALLAFAIADNVANEF